MEISQEGITKAELFIKNAEATKLTVYLDSAHLPTVGTGHLVVPSDKLKLGDTITQERSDALLAHDLQHAINGVAAQVDVELNPNQEAALISLTYNIGVVAFGHSTVLTRLNDGEYEQAADAFMMWVKSKGRRVQGLVNRRTAERELFLLPVENEPAPQI